VVAAPQVKRACAATDPKNSGVIATETIADLRKTVSAPARIRTCDTGFSSSGLPSRSVNSQKPLLSSRSRVCCVSTLLAECR